MASFARTRLRLVAAVLVVAGLAMVFAVPLRGGRAQSAATPTPTPAPYQAPATAAPLGPAVPPEVSQYANDWPAPQGNLAGTRAAGKSTITAASVGKLQVAWRFQLKVSSRYGGMSAPPLIVGDTVYLQDMMSNVFALDRATGKVKWEHDYNTPSTGPNGIALGYGMLYGGAGDSRQAFALDAASGKEVWRVTLSANPGEGIDMAPTVYGNTVYIATVPGSSTKFYRGGARGILFALDAKTGGVLWQFDTTTDNLWGNPRYNSGGGLWYPPSIDDQGNIYFGTGNAGPWPGNAEYPNASSRPGPNDYASSIVSLDPKTGALRWYRNAKPHDIFDLDFQNTPVLATLTINGTPTRVAIGSGKTGTVIAYNADTGQPLWAAAVGKHENDALQAVPAATPPVTVYPGSLGGVETPLAYADGTVFAAVVNWPRYYIASRSVAPPATGASPYANATGDLVALDAVTGRVKWDVALPSMAVGAATVANDVVFTGALDGVFRAYDARTGKQLWTYQASAGLNAPPAVAGDMVILPAAGPFVPPAAAGPAATPGGPQGVQPAATPAPATLAVIAFKLGS
jgi:glucose dehydrogenase